MEDLNLYINKKIEIILREISKKEYGIDKYRILELLEIIKNLHIEINDKNKTTLDLYNYKNEKVHEIALKNNPSSYVLQYPPIIKNGEVIMIKPILCIANFSNTDILDSTIYHELSHILSISKWKQIDARTFEHISGIIKEKYTYENKIIKNQRDIVDANEEINDFVATMLYSSIEKKKYITNKVLSKKQCAEYIKCRINSSSDENIKKFIGYYFSNNIEQIEQILLSDQYNSLESLNSFFKNIHNEKEIDL